MASPQKENGFTPIAHEILENICKLKLNGTQRSIIDVVWRYTYGFHRKEHELSDKFISNATDITERQIQRELKKLIENNILIVTKKHTCSSSKKIKFNKNHSTWGLKRQVTKKTGGGDELDRRGGVGLDVSGGVGLDVTRGDELDTQERKKDNIKDSIKDSDLKCFKFYNKNFSPITQTTAEEIGTFLDDGVEDALIVKCLEKAKEKEANWNYAKAILNTEFNNGIKTLKDFEGKNKSKKKKSTSPNEFKNMMEDFING